MVYLKKLLDKNARRSVYLVMGLFLMLSMCFYAEIHKGWVVEIRSSYQIVSDGFHKVLLYGDSSSVGIDDYVEFETSYELVSGYDNFEVSSFPQWAKGQGVIYRGNVREYKVIEKGHTIRRLIYDHHKQYGNNRALQLLFNTGMDSESDMRYLIRHAGFHVTALVYMIRKILQRYFYPDEALRYTVWISAVLTAIFNFQYSWVRVLSGLVCRQLYENKRDRFGIQACFLMLFRPYYINTVSFIIPMGLGFLNLFSEEKTDWLSRSIFIVMCQLRFYGYCDLVRTVLFSFFSKSTSLFFTAAFFSSLMPFKLEMSRLVSLILETADKIPEITVNGRLGFIAFGILYYLLLQYQTIRNRRYLIYVIGLLIINSNQSVLNGFYRISYLDIGQGDCAVVTFPFSSHGLLIDTGGNYYKDVGHDIIVPYLKSRGLRSVEVIISHEDYDHVGGLHSLAREFKVTDVHFEKHAELNIRGVDFIDPLYRYYYEDINDNSQITYFRIAGVGFLFTGDISKLVEEDLIMDFSRLDVDVLKVAHHGSRTATSSRFLSCFKPQFAIISAGRNNRFNHPDASVVQRLENYRVKVLCTKYDNAVEFMVFRHFTFYRTASGRYGFFMNGS